MAAASTAPPAEEGNPLLHRKQSRRIKSAPAGSLTEVLAKAICIMNNEKGWQSVWAWLCMRVGCPDRSHFHWPRQAAIFSLSFSPPTSGPAHRAEGILPDLE